MLRIGSVSYVTSYIICSYISLEICNYSSYISTAV
jgi:hypothetical protein